MRIGRHNFLEVKLAVGVVVQAGRDDPLGTLQDSSWLLNDGQHPSPLIFFVSAVGVLFCTCFIKADVESGMVTST